MFYVYILLCNDQSHYTGLTSNLGARLAEHETGLCPYTINRRPVKLMCYLAFLNKQIAAQFEQYLKSSSGFAFRNKHLLPS
jgi:putative endonuclease